MSAAADERIPLGVQCAVYASGLFANSPVLTFIEG